MVGQLKIEIQRNNTYKTTNNTQRTQTKHNITQHNDDTVPLIVIFTYKKTMAEVLGAVASAMAVVEVAGKVWSTIYKYYQVGIPPQPM